MLFNPFLAQQLGEEYMKDRLREAEQERLIREIRDTASANTFSPREVVNGLRALAHILVLAWRERVWG